MVCLSAGGMSQPRLRVVHNRTTRKSIVLPSVSPNSQHNSPQSEVSPKNLNPCSIRSFGDKCQYLAWHDPLALAVVERLVDSLIADAEEGTTDTFSHGHL